MKRKIERCFYTGTPCACELNTNPDSVYALVPFRPKYSNVFHFIREACEGAGLKAARSDSSLHSINRMCQVCACILQAGLIIADVSEPNANVYYELGLSHAFGKEVLLICQEPETVAIDIRMLQMMLYDPINLVEFCDLLGKYLVEWKERRQSIEEN